MLFETYEEIVVSALNGFTEQRKRKENERTHPAQLYHVILFMIEVT